TAGNRDSVEYDAAACGASIGARRAAATCGIDRDRISIPWRHVIWLFYDDAARAATTTRHCVRRRTTAAASSAAADHGQVNLRYARRGGERPAAREYLAILGVGGDRLPCSGGEANV